MRGNIAKFPNSLFDDLLDTAIVEIEIDFIAKGLLSNALFEVEEY